MVNKVIIIGNATRAVEIRQTKTGMSVANLSVATNKSWTDGKGVKQKKTEFHSVVLWGKLAEICAQFVQKGSQVFVEGELESSKYQDKSGNERTKTEIVAQNVRFLGARGQEAEKPLPPVPAEHDVPFDL